MNDSACSTYLLFSDLKSHTWVSCHVWFQHDIAAAAAELIVSNYFTTCVVYRRMVPPGECQWVCEWDRRGRNFVDAQVITLAASIGKRGVTVWRPSVRLFVCPSVPSFSVLNTARDAYSMWLARGSMRRGQYTFRPNKIRRTDRLVSNSYTVFTLLQ